jgi:hypothetical protein
METNCRLMEAQAGSRRISRRLRRVDAGCCQTNKHGNRLINRRHYSRSATANSSPCFAHRCGLHRKHIRRRSSFRGSSCCEHFPEQSNGQIDGESRAADRQDLGTGLDRHSKVASVTSNVISTSGNNVTIVKRSIYVASRSSMHAGQLSKSAAERTTHNTTAR